MEDRDALLRFLETHYNEIGATELCRRLGVLFSCHPDVPPNTRWQEMLSAVEQAGQWQALLALVEQDFPGQLSLRTGTRADANQAPGLRPLLSLVQSSPDPSARTEATTEAMSAPAKFPHTYASTPSTLSLNPPLLARDPAGEPPETGSSRIRFVHSYTLPRHWARRDQEIAHLLHEIQTNRHRVLALVAIGGAGKSALTRKLLEQLDAGGDVLEGGLWFSFYVEPEFDRFLNEACAHMIPGFDPKLHPSLFEKAAMLREAMDRGHYLLVMDGIEVMLVADRDRRDYGCFQDRAVRDFLLEVLSGSRSQIIISSRFPLTDLNGRPGFQAIELSDLQQEAADELLRSYGVQGSLEDRAPVYARFGTHALTMQLIGDYLTRYHEGRPEALQEITSFDPAAGQGLKIQAMLDAYWRRLTPEERFFLTRMSAFRGGVDERSLIVLNKSGDAFDPRFRQMVENLLHSPLVIVERRGRRSRITAHPLIKTFFYERMADAERDQTHRALKDYAQGLPVPERPRTLEDYAPLIDACYHCLRVGLYREAYQIYRRNNMDNALRWWGHYSEAMALLEPLRQAGLGDAPSWQSEKWQRSWVENETALLATLQGNTDLAIERFRRSAELDAESGDGPGESASLQNLVGVLTQRGEYQAALEALERSRAIEARLRRYEKEDMLAGLEGVCRAEMGQSQRAFELLCQALELSTQHLQTRSVCYWTWRIGDLYLSAGQIMDGRAQHTEALRIARREQYRDFECYALRGLADSYRLEDQLERAAETYTSALRLARTLGNPYLENEVRLGLARLGERERNYQEAQGQARQVLARAEECVYRPQAAQAHLILARAARVINDQDALHLHARQARNLIQQCPHALAIQELKQLQREIPDLLS
ncbi:MAG: tetratricopeptide repeat protein [Chloroherpetonaceae bacterium]|nr:tetratricopeptide repeat protein [Chthonomonadaceae bacterium]MDW8208378.1 tetratricopeptide repeat protein [Chloroherpetonaceae bacterium]